MPLNRLLLVMLLLASAVCQGDGSAYDRQRLDDATHAWDEARILSYNYAITSGGAFGATAYRISVIDGSCKATSRLVRAKTRDVWKPDSCDGLTVPELLAELRRRIDTPHVNVTMELDSRLGYPTYFSTDSSDLYDSLWTFRASDFCVRSRRAPN